MKGMMRWWSNSTERLKWPRLLVWMLAIGLFIQISGKVWIESGSARNAQIYIWLLLPALIFLVHGFCVRGIELPTWHYLPWAAFLFWVGLSTVWAEGAETGAFSLAKRGLLIALYLVAIYWLMLRDQVFLRRALLAGIFVVAMGALASLIYQFGVLDRPLAYRAYRIDRLGIGDFANYGWPVAAGIFHGALAVWALGLALEQGGKLRQVIIWLGIFSILALYVLLTYTRGAWFALAGASILVVFLQKSKLGWFLLLAGFALVLLLVVIFSSELVVEIEQRQLSGRGPIWEYYFEVMSGHWIFGQGLGTPFEFRWENGETVSPHAHSLYLQQMYDSGIISLLLLGTGVVAIFHKVWRMRNNVWVRLALPALVFALIALLTDVERIFTRPGDYWTLFWLPIGILLAINSRAEGDSDSTQYTPAR